MQQSEVPLWRLLVPSIEEERDPAFRAVLAGVLHTGLRQCGAIGIVGAILYIGLSVLGLGYELNWTYQAFRVAGSNSQIAVVGILIVAALSVFALVLAQTECSLQSGRLFGFGAVLITVAVATFEGAVRGTFNTEYVVSVYLVMIAIIPFHPAQVLGVGGGVMGVVYLLGPGGLAWGGGVLPSMPMGRHLIFMGGVSLIIAGAGGALYRRHQAFARTQATLRQSRDRLRRTQEIGRIGGWEFLPNTNMVKGTAALWKLLELPPTTSLELDDWFELYSEEGRQRLRGAMERSLEAGDEFDLEVPLHKDRGGDRWVRIRGETATQEDRQKRIVGALQDISRRKKREQELRSAKEEAEQMSRMKTVFLANMSHEIRTPLTSIIGFAEAIGDEIQELKERVEAADFEAIDRFAGLVKNSGHRLLESLDALLNFSRLEAGEMDLPVGPVDLVEEVEQIADQMGAQAKKANVDLRVQTPAEPVWAQANEGGLQIVLRNLVSNGIKYTDAGGVVWVRARTEEGEAVLEVEDTGIGMAPEDVSTLFEPFRQGSEGWSREYEGTGLGLAVAQRAVNEMNGSIGVETEPDNGTRFAVWLAPADGKRDS